MNHTELKKRSQKWTVFIARFGYITKGVFYIILGVLALQAGLRAGKTKVRLQTILITILDQPFGQVLLGIMVLGLVGYAFWRIVQAIFDLDRKGNHASDLVLRTSFFISGVSYTLLAYSGAKLLLGQSSNQAAVNIDKLVSAVYQLPFGADMVGVVGLILLVISLYQFIAAITANFKKHFDWSRTSHISGKAIFFLGRVGHAARGLVYLLIGYSLIQAAIASKPGLAGGYSYAFKRLAGIATISQVPWVLEITAAGMILYGFYALLLARYRWFSID